MKIEDLSREIARPLSDAEIINWDIPAMLKSEFDGQLPAVILYEATPRNGHWSLIHKVKNKKGKPTIEFFDSYGMKPDQAIKIMQIDDTPDIILFLMQSIINGKAKASFNDFPFQVRGGDINTCGRHCIVRYMFRHNTLEEYTRKMKNASKKTGLDYDEIVTYLTS